MPVDTIVTRESGQHGARRAARLARGTAPGIIALGILLAAAAWLPVLAAAASTGTVAIDGGAQYTVDTARPYTGRASAIRMPVRAWRSGGS